MSFMSKPVEHFLNIRRLGYEEYPAMGILAKSWEIEARGKKQKAVQSEADHFHSCQLICEDISKYLLGSGRSSHRKVYVCENEKGEQQGMMVFFIQSADIYLHLLVTHPQNIRSKLNPQRTSGVGTLLMKFAERQVIDLNKEYIYTTSMLSAESFYEQRGYTNQILHMVKTAEKIRDELKLSEKLAA